MQRVKIGLLAIKPICKGFLFVLSKQSDKKPLVNTMCCRHFCCWACSLVSRFHPPAAAEDSEPSKQLLWRPASDPRNSCWLETSGLTIYSDLHIKEKFKQITIYIKQQARWNVFLLGLYIFSLTDRPPPSLLLNFFFFFSTRVFVISYY